MLLIYVISKQLKAFNIAIIAFLGSENIGLDTTNNILSAKVHELCRFSEFRPPMVAILNFGKTPRGIHGDIFVGYLLGLPGHCAKNQL